MTQSHEDQRQIGEQLDALANKSARKFFAFSPNDILVQVALPLVLILAIAVRLMVIGQSMASQDQGPVIMDLWKQQLILRIDAALDRWERESELAAFPGFERVLWGEAWPDDERFKRLCANALILEEPAALVDQLYEKALRFEGTAAPEADQAGTSPWLIQLYDPLSSVRPDDPSAIPPEYVITPERRQFAMSYIEERCRGWRDQVENLQWGAVNRIARSLPIQEGITERSMRDQMQQLAQALSERGYPLLPSVVHAY